VGAAPVQNIGAYGLELKDRFTVAGRGRPGHRPQRDAGRRACASATATACSSTGFEGGLAGKSVITRVRLRLPRPWQPVLGYLDLERRMAETGKHAPDARTIFDWVCAIRRAKLPDPAVIGNAGSFFKNPVVSAEQCRDIIGRDPEIVHYPLPDGSVKLAAGWLIDACGWKGKSRGPRRRLRAPGPGAGQPRRRQRRRGGDAGPRHPGKCLRPLRHPPGARARAASFTASHLASSASTPMPPVNSVLTTPSTASQLSLRRRQPSHSPQPIGNARPSPSAFSGPSRSGPLSCISTTAGMTMVMRISTSGLGLVSLFMNPLAYRNNEVRPRAVVHALGTCVQWARR
jgi:hypothetical protein